MKKKKSSLTGNRAFACSYCSFANDSRFHLRKHIKAIHNKIIGPLGCCGIYFSDKEALKHHTQACHPPKYECGVCDRRFYTSTILQSHLLVHSEFKEFKCNVCDYETSLKGNIKLHMERKNHWSGPYEKWRVSIEESQRYKCNICGRGYQFPSILRQHMAVHPGYKKFKCDICSYATGIKSHLKRHFKRHEFIVRKSAPNRRLRSSRRTTMSTENGESPVIRRRRSTRIIEEEESEDEAQSSTPIDMNVVDSGESYPSSQMTAHHLKIVNDMEIKNNASKINFTDGCDSHQEEDAVKTFSGNRRLRNSRRTTMSTENVESHVVEKKLSAIITKEESEDQTPSYTPIDTVVNSRESWYPFRKLKANHLVSVDDMKIKNNASEINIIDGSDSHQEDDDVEVLYVDRRKRSSRSTVMSTENSESPVIEKNRFSRSIQEESEDQAPSDSPMDIVMGRRESYYPLRQMNASRLESVGEMEMKNSATNSTFSVEHISSQRLPSNPSLPVLSDPIHEEARQLRSQISLATTTSAVLSILERLMELSAYIMNQIRFVGSVDVELRSKAVELFEYVWGISKRAVSRWEDMEGSMSRNNFLRAVQYAYETLPVFVNLESSKHLEMMEPTVLLILNTVRNCRRPSSIGKY